MNYELTITKREDNPNYEEELKERNKRRSYGFISDTVGPSKQIVTNALVVNLTEDQFKAIKKEVFKAFE